MSERELRLNLVGNLGVSTVLDRMRPPGTSHSVLDMVVEDGKTGKPSSMLLS